MESLTLSKPQLEAKELGPRNFFSLPAEIRRSILKQALTLNTVYWHPQNISVTGHTGESQGVLSPSRLQKAPLGHSNTYALPGFLTTSRQSYEEGMPIFYQNNVFFLPLGPLDVTVKFFDQIRPEYRSLIKAFGLTMDYRDLGFVVLDSSEWNRQSYLADHDAHYYEHRIQTVLRGIWQKKLEWIKSQQHVEKVAIQFEFGHILKKHNAGNPGRMILRIASMEGQHMTRLVQCFGWKKLKSLINAGLIFYVRAQNDNEMLYDKNMVRLGYSIQKSLDLYLEKAEPIGAL
ncbi:MAG: hypothetical protein Q9167_007356 [Letrouitia subvulpina]